MQTWTLIFDLDGTLVDTAPDLAASTNHVMRHLGLRPVDECEIRPFVGHGALAMIGGAAAAHGRRLAEQELYDLFEIFISHYMANIAVNSVPYEGTVAALESFKARGTTLAVCTNKIEAHARALLDALDMSRYFSAIAGRDSLGFYKPDPKHLTGTIALAGGAVDRSIMIGDTETDIKTAQAASIPVIGVDFGYSVAPVTSFGPDVVISHFRDLEPATERLITASLST